MRKASVLVLLIAIFIVPFQPVLACGPEYLDPVFGFTKHGEYPLTDYSGGKLGLIPNTYGRISLFVFYRYLQGSGLSKSEQKEVARAIARRVGTFENDSRSDLEKPKESALDRWIAARDAVLPKSEEPDQFKLGRRTYSYYYNCLDNAFENAISTLEARRNQGYSEKDLKSWITGQDAVFSNCNSEGMIPAKLDTDAPEWLQKDTQYQIAAALFYQGKYADARNAFRLIGEDKSSPWWQTARYLVARTYIREAGSVDSDDENSTLSPEQAEAQKQQMLANAALELGTILDDSELKEFHDSASKLLGLVKYRADPENRTIGLSERLADSADNPNIFNDLTDYILLMDQLESRAERNADENPDTVSEEEKTLFSQWGYRIRRKDVAARFLNSDLNDWLITFHSVDGSAHAYEKWQATKQPHWLAAAISKAKVTDKNNESLIVAADALTPESYAYSTAMYHAIRLSIESGNRARAIKLSDEVFANGFSKLPTATKNSFFAQRTVLAKNLSEFLKYSKRTPTDYLWSFDINESGLGPGEYKEVKEWRNREMFGEDAVEVLNKSVPLSVWLEAARNPELPDHLKDFVASAGWVRAVILKDKVSENAFAPLVQRYSTVFRPLFSNYMNARNAADKEAAALLVIERYTALEPLIQSGWGRRDDDPTVIDSIRGNWWCLIKDDGAKTESPSFVSNAEFQKGKAEYKKISELGQSATSIASRAVEFADKNPRNRSTPEILHLAVRASRYGCTDDNTGTYSKAAFDLLHTRYRSSAWTRKTPYWFK